MMTIKRSNLERLVRFSQELMDASSAQNQANFVATALQNKVHVMVFAHSQNYVVTVYVLGSILDDN